MNSAFGIDHGVISKSYKKLVRNVNAVKKPLRSHPKPDDTFKDRMKVNWVQGRMQAGAMGGRYGVAGSLKRAREAGDSVDVLGRSYRDVNLAGARAEKAKGRARKEFANASVAGYSANARRNRVLP